MIRKMKRKFIFLAMTAICVLLCLVVAGMNVINYSFVVEEADSTLELLSQNRGRFPDMKGDWFGPMPRPMSPELPYESRYFSVLLDHSGKVILTDTGKIAAVDSEAAARYGQKAFYSGDRSGFIGDFRYLRSAENTNHRIVFLDCGRKLDSFHTFLYASVGMTLAGIVAVFFVIFFASGRIVRPIAESYEKQKRFITDAGHELKTPLTIINANVDVLEMEQQGGNEFLEDIRQQTRRLTDLTNDLVLLARMEEAKTHLQKIDFPLSEIVSEAAQPFHVLAQTQSKSFSCHVQPMLTMNGNAKAIGQLVSLLMDNAVKYSPEGGSVELTLQQAGKNVCLTVTNTTEDPVTKEALSHVFDRFYRADASRSSQIGGHGIGLSVAQAIVHAHGGKLQVATQDCVFRISATFSQQ